MAPDSRIVQTKLTDLEERPGVGEQLGALVCRAPLVAELGRATLPRLEVEGRPDHVEEGEQHEGEVLQELRAAAEEELQFPRVVNGCQRFQSGRGFAYPNEKANESGDAKSGGVVAQPGEVEGNLDAEVITDLA